MKTTQPQLFVFAGVDGAGKTTFYYNELEKGKLFDYRINIYEIVSSFGDWKNEKDQIRASKIAIKQRKSFLKNKYSFNLETTLSGSSSLNTIKKANEKG